MINLELNNLQTQNETNTNKEDHLDLLFSKFLTLKKVFKAEISKRDRIIENLKNEKKNQDMCYFELIQGLEKRHRQELNAINANINYKNFLNTLEKKRNQQEKIQNSLSELHKKITSQRETQDEILKEVMFGSSNASYTQLNSESDSKVIKNWITTMLNSEDFNQP